jgi:hypothetical protein
MTSPLVLPRGVHVSEIADPRSVLRAAGILMTDEAERLDAIERAQFVLVRIDDTGERWRCRECGCKHKHFTLKCVERPFRGLRAGLLAYWQNTAARPRDLTPEQRARRLAVSQMLGFASPLPSLADRHPETAAKLATPESDFDLGSWVLGTIDPISETKARTLAALINARARQPVIRF